MVFATLGIWALSVTAFYLLKNGTDSVGFSLWITWAILPILFFASSYIMGARDRFGKLKWITPPVFALMYSASGAVSTMAVDGILYRSVIWPGFAKLPLGLMISLAGLLLGCFAKRKKK